MSKPRRTLDSSLWSDVSSSRAPTRFELCLEGHPSQVDEWPPSLRRWVFGAITFSVALPEPVRSMGEQCS
jgi:hypothetical protein